jgi:hypothetical protein
LWIMFGNFVAKVFMLKRDVLIVSWFEFLHNSGHERLFQISREDTFDLAEL